MKDKLKALIINWLTPVIEHEVKKRVADATPEIDYNALSDGIKYHKLAEKISEYDVAQEIDMSNLARYIEVDCDDLAESFAIADIAECVNLTELSNEFDQDELAMSIIRNLRNNPITITL